MNCRLLPRRQRRWVLVLLLGGVSAFCIAADVQQSPRLNDPVPPQRYLNILGNDGEQVPDPTAFPYSAVGLLRWNDNTSCAATLVAPTFVLAAAECVLDSDGDLLTKSINSPDFAVSEVSDAATSLVARVHKQSEFWTEWTGNTYVLVELDSDLGVSRGTLQLAAPNTFPQHAGTNVQLVGYADTAELGMLFQSCKIRFPSEFDGPSYELHHDCDVSAKRSPGSPMLVRSTNLETYIIGIAIEDNQPEDGSTETSSSHDSFANRGVLASFIQPHLSFLLEKAKASSTSSSFPGQSSSSFEVEQSNSSSSFLDGPSSSSTSTSQHVPDVAASGASAALAPTPASPSEVSVSSPPLGIAATAAYTCIGLVSASWIAIIFIAARRFRSRS